MSFTVHKVDDGHNLPFEYLPCGAITPKMGMALVQTGGKLVTATGDTAPTYISMTDRETACTAGDVIPVVRVGKGTIWETEAAADMSAVNQGDMVTIDDTGLMVTATTNGVAEVVAMDGTAVGSKVYVRF